MNEHGKEEIEDTVKIQIELLEMEETISGFKNTLDGIYNRFDSTEIKISALKA